MSQSYMTFINMVNDQISHKEIKGCEDNSPRMRSPRQPLTLSHRTIESGRLGLQRTDSLNTTMAASFGNFVTTSLCIKPKEENIVFEDWEEGSKYIEIGKVDRISKNMNRKFNKRDLSLSSLRLHIGAKDIDDKSPLKGLAITNRTSSMYAKLNKTLKKLSRFSPTHAKKRLPCPEEE